MAIKEETELFKNKYRVPSARLPGYNYANTGLYFVTICVKNRECVFGRVRQGNMELSEIGEIVKEELLKTNVIRSNVQIDEWVIMPNHVHVIISLDNQKVETPRWGVSDTSRETPYQGVSDTSRETPYQGVSTKDHVTGRKNLNWRPNTLGSIINQFKSICTKRVRQIDSNFTWQPRFHDHIIRNEKSLEEIRQYILKNPEKWLEDDLYERPLPKIQK